MSQSFSNNYNSFNTTYISPTAADDRASILSWLSPLDPKLRHQDIRDRRVENVGEWVLQTEQFRSWNAGSEAHESDNAVLFCCGDPGVGKTYISSLVIDTLCDQAEGGDATVACFYFDFAAQNEQSPTRVLGYLLKQLVFGLEEIPEEILRACQGRKGALGGQGPQFSRILKMLQTTLALKRAFLCIDALDECAAEHRVTFLHSLNQLLQQSPGTRIFMTARPHILPEIGRRLAGRVVAMLMRTVRGDVIRYLRTRLAADTTPDAMDSSLEADILKKIPEGISGIFLLISLRIDAILQEPTIHRRRQKLNASTEGLGLDSAYGETLDRIKAQDGARAKLGMAALMWISHSERPLRADELCHALAVEIGSPSLNTDDVPSVGTVLSCCQGLVAMHKRSFTVRLIHFTLQEYLGAHSDFFGTAHSTMAETCLSYLNSQQVKTLSTTPAPDLRDIPFLRYSSVYWGTHARRGLSDRAKLLALKLFDDYSNHISTRILLEVQKEPLWVVDLDKLSLFTGLHCASLFGIVEIVAGLIEVEGYDINQRDCVDNTPLLWAAHNGHEGVVKILLERRDVALDRPGKGGQTPLWRAASKGHEGVVKILLERREVNPDKTDNGGLTPFWCAAWNEHEGVLRTLLERGDINPDKPDNDGRTPLWYAAWYGCERVAKVLLERDEVNPDKPDPDGQTPLRCAALRGHERVVKMLLERGEVDPDRTDNVGRTPLRCAASNGHERVVKMLLEQDRVNPEKRDDGGLTPLWCAAWNGHTEVVKMLERSRVNPNKPDSDNDGQMVPRSPDLA